MKVNMILAVVITVFFTGSVAASGLKVRVFERGGKTPLAGAAVCVGTQARIDQFGAQRTDDKGYAEFDTLPSAGLLVTASMSGHKSEQELIVTGNSERLLVLSLASGGGGAVCPLAGIEDTGASADLAVRWFRVGRGASETTSRKVSLDNSLRGRATQYRASERSDFSDTEWRYYSTSPDFMLSAEKGRKMVYFQVRKHATVNGATLETLSPVVRDSIILK